MKDKILNFLIIFLLTFLILNFFFNKKEDSGVVPTGIKVSVLKDSYTVPANISMYIENYTSDAILFNPCENTSIMKDGEKIMLTDSCDVSTIIAGSAQSISLGQYYDAFITPGEYTFETLIGEKKYISQVSIEHRGTIAKIFIYFIYGPIYNLMIFLIENLSYSLGWAIILITIIIRIFLLYPQHKMMISQKKLQLIQPKIKEIQEKHKGNHQALGVELMSLYKKEKVNPMGSCGLLLIQMPILLVLYNVLINIENSVNYYYIYDFLKPFAIESIVSNFYGIDLLNGKGLVGLLLALGVAALQFLQIKFSLSHNKKTKQGEIILEKKKGENSYESLVPDPEMMNKFMLYGMPVMVGIFTYSLSAGIGIYWGISTAFSIFQQLAVNKIIKK